VKHLSTIDFITEKSLYGATANDDFMDIRGVSKQKPDITMIIKVARCKID